MTEERPPTTRDLGQKLREARERKGVSLRQIANSTKIAVAVLDGLERNDISKLPGGIFGRAFVRSFATEVGLDPEAAIQEFITQFRDDSVTVGHPQSEQIEDKVALESTRRRARTLLGLVVLVVLVAAVVVYFGLAGRGDLSLATLRESPPSVSATATAAPIDAAGALSTPAPARQPVGGAAPLPTANERAVSQNTPADRLVVALSMTRDCWVSATVDGQKQIEEILKPGDGRSFGVANELVLSVGDAGAVRMTINGADARPLGKSGEVVTVRMTPGNGRTFLPVR
ncbi:MAG: RodZ domain-containing protein [Acidobacteriota bacterium]